MRAFAAVALAAILLQGWVGNRGGPTGALMLFSAGTSCPQGSDEATDLDGYTLVATTLAHANVGGTGGSDNITPAGSNTAPTFTGSSATSSATTGGTPAGTNATVSITPLLNAVAWPAGVPTFSGSALATHTHTYSDIVNHTHPNTAVLTIQGGTTAIVTGTHVMASTATGGSARAVTSGDSIAVTNVNPSGGVASGTTAATTGGTPAGTVAWPAGVPTVTGASTTVGAQTFTGSALATHTHTLTATGTNSAPAFTGTQFDNRSAFIRIIICRIN